MHKYLLIVFLLIATACSQQNNTQPENEVDHDELQPPMFAIVNDEKHELEPGGYEWEIDRDGTMEVIQTDAAAPPQIAEQMKPLTVKGDVTVDFEAESNPDITVYLWNGDRSDVLLKNDQLQIPTEKGKYIYEVKGEWTDKGKFFWGEVSYTFLVKVE